MYRDFFPRRRLRTLTATTQTVHVRSEKEAATIAVATTHEEMEASAALGAAGPGGAEKVARNGKGGEACGGAAGATQSLHVAPGYTMECSASALPTQLPRV